MRNPFLFISLSVLLWSCNKEEPVIPKVPTWDDLHLSWSRDLLPDAYYSNITKAVFINDLGDEKKLDLRLDTTTQLVSKDTIHYSQERFLVVYTDPLVLGFYLQVSAQIEYSASGLKIFENLFAVLLPPNSVSYAPLIDFAGPDSTRNGIFLPSKSIAGLQFDHVFGYTLTAVTDNSYNELYYAPDLGIVGFQGKDGEFWGLKRYE